MEQLVQESLELEEYQRGEFLERRCREDNSLRDEVESLLAFAKNAEEFLETPALEVAARAVVGERNATSAGVPKAENAPLEVGLTGCRIGAYTVVSHIGRGGMGNVWLAERTDGRFDRKAAIKFLNL
ncbi:MAG: hypothetical protein JO356_20120, partial [Acidobacteria bacterium]|nr:hypothetical protein [Acidobacteriota bacterium]